MEDWKPVKGFEGWYEISNMGNIRSVTRLIQHKPDRFTDKGKSQLNDGKPIKQSLNNKGYYCVLLWRNSKAYKRYIHRLIAEVFIPNDGNKKEVNHVDGNHQNNSIENLEWCTKMENMHHAFNTGLISTMKKVKSTDLISKEERYYDSINGAARELGISHTGIVQQLKGKAKTCNGCTWEYI